MPRNGSGTYTLPAGNPVVTGTTIATTWANNTLNDVATALTGSLSADGQTTPTADQPMATYKHTNVGNAAALNQYATASQVQNGDLIELSSVSGTNTITATAPLSMAAYAQGQMFTFVSAGANTGATTININSLGAKSITKLGTTALSSGDIASGAVCVIVYDGTRFQLVGGGRQADPVTYPISLANGGTGQTTAYAALDALTVQGANIASASTTNIAAATGESVTITGTTTITAFGTAAAGVKRNLTFSGVLTLTHNGTSLILPGATNITTAAGDIATFLSLGSGNWRCINYQQNIKLSATLSTDGEIYYPNGLIEKWGYATRTGNITTVTFPTPFPTACLNVSLTCAGPSVSGGFSNAPGVDSDTLTVNGFDYGSGSAVGFVYWRALGK